jgi:low affinity Fe/Cu permease
LKLDEIIRATQHAGNEMIDIEKLSDPELGQLAQRYVRIRRECEQRKQRARKEQCAA